MKKLSAIVLRRSAFLLPTGLSILLGNALCHCNARRTDLEKRFQREIAAIARDFDLPGMTAAYVLDDGAVKVFATGFADVELEIPMRTDSRMLAASIGKTFTGALALDLAREGRLDLDAPVKRYLGKKPWFSRLPNRDTMTVRHLLTHGAGIEDHVHSPKFARTFREGIRDTNDTLAPEDLIAFVLDTPARAPAGRAFHYSDTGYILVGLIIEKASGNDLFAEIRNRFIDPLGLTLTAPSDRTRLPGLAAGYLAQDNLFGLPKKTTLRPGVMAWNPALEWAGGGFISNPGDLAIWGKALYDGRALPGDYLKNLRRGTRISPTQSYGIAAIIEESPEGVVSYGHRGWIPGYVSGLKYFKKHKAAIAFQMNTDIGIIGSERDIPGEIEVRLARILFPARKPGESP